MIELGRIIAAWPGKSAGDDGIAHPALYHMLDVAAVAECLIALEPLSAQMRQALIRLTGLHDLGKISESFRTMLTTGTRQYRRHWEMTEVLLHQNDTVLGDLLGSNALRRGRIYASVAGHHGAPPILQVLDDPRLETAIGPQAMRDAAAVIGMFAGLWPDASLNQLNKESELALNWWLPGFVAAADWVGSNKNWFPPCAAGVGPADYLAGARIKAALAVEAAGLTVPATSDAVLFDFDLRPTQRAAAGVTLPDGPMLAGIEDETGAGKTEAALILAQRMMLAGKGRGMFLALPTTATADAMFRRARQVVRRMCDGPPSLTLAHGRAGLSGDFRAVRLGDRQISDAPICTDWLADNRRRALLATVGVGTIDQALLSVLPTRFATLRHYGLASKILIVDEVHEMGAPLYGNRTGPAFAGAPHGGRLGHPADCNLATGPAPAVAGGMGCR